MITPKKLSTIAERYDPDWLNKKFKEFIKNNNAQTKKPLAKSIFTNTKKNISNKKPHQEWFLELKNNTKLKNVKCWNQFIEFCLKKDKNFTIDFSDCIFENEEECDFSGYKKNKNFLERVFPKIEFKNATFKYEANFEKATFKDEADFEMATFENEANFKKAIFKEEANFKRVKFKGETDFFDAIFDNIDGKKIDFSNTTFKKNVKFDFSKRQANTELTTERYVEISFENATFEKEATFLRRKFAGDTSFIDAKFYYPPTFSPGEEYNPDLLNFTRTKLILNSLIPPKFLLSAFIPQTFFLWKQDITILTRVRNLRKLAGQIKEYDFEINLFILERLLNSRIAIKKWCYNPLKLIQQLLIGLYWISSNYGRSALIPTGWLLYSIAVLKDYLDKYVVKNSACSNYDLWLVSSSNAIPFFNKFSEKSKFILQRCFTDSDTAKNMEEIPNMVFVYFTIHGIFSIVMIFLFSLAIRNYFRIK